MTHIIGTTGNDRDDTALHGSEDADLIEGLAGYDDLYGAGGNDTLDGGTGVDRMYGGAGNDTYYVDNKHDMAVELHGEGRDTVCSSVAYTIGDNIEKLILTGIGNISATGNSDNNTLIGNSGNNRLNGGAGADTLGGGLGNDTLDGGKGGDDMKGGAGDDRYYIDNKLDVVTEYAGQGSDTVYINGTYTLGLNIENLTLSGSGDRFGTGNALDNIITGNAGNNTLGGADGNDVINGGKGADTMRGGMGDDVFYVDNAGDTVTEYSGQGTDLVFSSVSFKLGPNVENLTLTGTGDISAMGNTMDNNLTGNGGDNVLDGAQGNDRIDGGAGFDTASYLYSGSGVHVDLRLSGAQNTGGAGHDTLIAIEAVTGSTYADVLNGQDRTFEGNTLISAGLDGLPANGHSGGAIMASDGSNILFATDATNISVGDTLLSDDLFVRDTATGVLFRVTSDSNGQALDGFARGYTYGASPHEVIFAFDSSDGLSNGIYSKNIDTGDLKRLVSGNYEHIVVSADGSKLFYVTAAALSDQDTNGAPDLYMRDIATGATTLVSATSAGHSAYGGVYTSDPSSYTVSADGTYVVFSSAAAGLADGDGTGLPNLYLKNTQTGEISILVAGTAAGVISPMRFYGHAPQFSVDGSKLLFVSDSPTLDPDHPIATMKAFVLDMTTHALTDVSADFDGYIDGAIWGGDSSHVALIGRTTTDGAVNQQERSDVVVKDLVTGQYHFLAYDIGYFDYISPFDGSVSFSADGRYMVYGNGQVYLHDNNVSADARIGDDVLKGDGGNDKLYGNGGDDQLYGGAGKDWLEGGDGYDHLYGGAGDDTYVVTTTYINGIFVQDVVSEQAGEGVDTVMANASYTLTDNVENLVLGVSGTSNYFDGTGNALDNVLTGSDETNTLYGKGDDHLYGNNGNDIIHGGGGSDWIEGGAGNDTLSDDIADPVGDGTSPPDRIYGDDGDDAISVFGANGLIFGGSGDDHITATGSGNQLSGDDGNDTLTGGAYADSLEGGVGDDIIHGNGGDDSITGGAGTDLLDGGSGNDRIIAGAGTTVTGGEGDDYIELNDIGGTADGGAGFDEIHGNGGGYTLSGGAGSDFLTAATGINTLNGGDGDDFVYGGAGNDTLSGNAGNDFIWGGGGLDTVDGGAGDDAYILTANSGHATGVDSAGNDFVLLGPDIDISQLLITTIGGVTYYGLKDTGSANTDASLATNYISFAAGSIESQKVWDDVFPADGAAANDAAASAKVIDQEIAHSAPLATTWDYVQLHDWLFG